MLLYLRAFLLITQRKSGNVEWKNCSPIACCSNMHSQGIDVQINHSHISVLPIHPQDTRV